MTSMASHVSSNFETASGMLALRPVTTKRRNPKSATSSKASPAAGAGAEALPCTVAAPGAPATADMLLFAYSEM